MQVRTYRDADREAVLGLWERARIGRPWLDLGAEIEEKRKRDRSLFLVAIERGSLVGTVMGAYDGRRGWVYHLAVEPALQGRGIGRLLMDELERRMARLGIVKVNLQVRADNTQVIGFYEQLGYKDDHLTSMSKWLRPPD
jgi:ribosomal protein S18 acetylase RimI-like enzyme